MTNFNKKNAIKIELAYLAPNHLCATSISLTF